MLDAAEMGTLHAIDVEADGDAFEFLEMGETPTHYLWRSPWRDKSRTGALCSIYTLDGVAFAGPFLIPDDFVSANARYFVEVDITPEIDIPKIK